MYVCMYVYMYICMCAYIVAPSVDAEKLQQFSLFFACDWHR